MEICGLRNENPCGKLHKQEEWIGQLTISMDCSLPNNNAERNKMCGQLCEISTTFVNNSMRR